MDDDDGDARADSAERTMRGGRSRRIWGIVAILVVMVLVVWWIAVSTSSRTPDAAATSSPLDSASAHSSGPPASDGATPAPEPSDENGGNVDPGAFPELPPVSPDQPAQADGIRADLTDFESVTGEVVVPGEVQAAAVRVTVQITNTGSAPLDLDLVVVNAYIGPDRDPAATYQQPGGEPVSGSLDPGATATGVYLFRIPEDRRSDVTFVVDYRGGEPALTWRGQVP